MDSALGYESGVGLNFITYVFDGVFFPVYNFINDILHSVCVI